MAPYLVQGGSSHVSDGHTSGQSHRRSIAVRVTIDINDMHCCELQADHGREMSYCVKEYDQKTTSVMIITNAAATAVTARGCRDSPDFPEKGHHRDNGHKCARSDHKIMCSRGG